MRLASAAAVFAFAAVLAACGGGGSSNVVPGSGHAPGVTQPSPGKVGVAHVNVVLKIPPATQQSHARKPFFISPNTASIVFAVVPMGQGTPTPAEEQLFPIATPSPCSTAPPSGAETCTFDVQAPIGTDIFYVATFAVANPAANTTPLADFVSGAIAVGSPGPGPTPSPLSFVVNGIVNSVVITVPSPDPGNTPNTQVLTAGVAATAQPLGVTAYDASGAPILADGFQAPLTVNVTPANAGVTLAVAATCPGSSGNGPTIEIGCAADLANVTFAYDGSITPDSNDHITDTFAIRADEIVSPEPSPASVVLAGNIQTYELLPAVAGSHVNYLYFLPMSNGQYLYLVSQTIGEGEQTAGGTFDPATGIASSPTELTGEGNVSSAAIAPFGNLWTDNSGPLDCFDSVASALAGNAPSVSGLYPTAPNTDTLYPEALTVDSAGNLWYLALDQGNESGQAYVGYFSTASGCATVITNPPVAQFTLTGDTYDFNPYLAALPGGGVAVQSSDTTPTAVFKLTTATTPGNVSPITMNLASGYSGGIAVDGTGTLYASTADYETAGNVESMASGASAFTTLFSLPPSPQGTFPYPDPYNLNLFSPTNGAADRLMYDEYDYTAVGLVENLASPQPELIGFPNGNDVYNGAYGTGGAEWVPYVDNSFNVQVARVLPTTTWSVPNLQIATTNCSTSKALFSVLERGDSGPFVLNIPGTSGVTSLPITGADHDFLLTIPGSYPTFTAQVTDSHGRSESFSATSLAANPYSCDIARRSNHRGPRPFRKPHASSRA